MLVPVFVLWLACAVAGLCCGVLRCAVLRLVVMHMPNHCAGVLQLCLRFSTVMDTAIIVVHCFATLIVNRVFAYHKSSKGLLTSTIK